MDEIETIKNDISALNALIGLITKIIHQKEQDIIAMDLGDLGFEIGEKIYVGKAYREWGRANNNLTFESDTVTIEPLSILYSSDDIFIKIRQYNKKCEWTLDTYIPLNVLKEVCNGY